MRNPQSYLIAAPAIFLLLARLIAGCSGLSRLLQTNTRREVWIAGPVNSVRFKRDR